MRSVRKVRKDVLVKTGKGSLACRPQETQSKYVVPSTFTLVGVLEPVPADPFAVAEVLGSPEEEGVSDLEVADAPTPDWEAPADDPDT